MAFLELQALENEGERLWLASYCKWSKGYIKKILVSSHQRAILSLLMGWTAEALGDMGEPPAIALITAA